jgi:thiol-disulfide isomerase/thioredoxin
MLLALVAIIATAPALAGGRIGAPLPRLQLPNVNGDLVALRDTTAQMTVVNFWASWCAPCRDEIPALLAVSRRWGRHVRVVGIAVDSGKPAAIAAFAEKHGIEYPVLVADTGWVRQHFDLTGIPVTLIVDRHGIIQARLTGPQSTQRLIWIIRRFLRR